jgi:hypothetical protein
MQFPQNEFFTRVVRDFDVAYTYFLVYCHVLDTPMAKAAFYAACERIVRDDPLPVDPVMQGAIKAHLVEAQDKALEEYVGLVEQIFTDVVQQNI